MTTVEETADLAPQPTTLRFRPSRWTAVREHWALVLMLICAGLTGPVGYAGQLGFAAMIGLAGLFSLPMLGVKRRPILEVGIALLLALWCVASELWSIDKPPADLHRYKAIESVTAVKLVLEVGVYGAFLYLMRELPQRWANRIMAVLAASLIFCAVLISIDAMTNCAVYRALRLSAHAADKPEIIRRNASRGVFTLALLFWPAVLWMRRAGWVIPMAIFVIAFFLSALLFRVDAPLVAVVLGGIALFSVRRFGRAAVWALLAATVLYLALEPTAFDLFGRYLPTPHDGDGVAKESWGVRVELWRLVSRLIGERPFLGWGIDSSRVIAGVPMHPHSAAMQKPMFFSRVKELRPMTSVLRASWRSAKRLASTPR